MFSLGQTSRSCSERISLKDPLCVELSEGFFCIENMFLYHFSFVHLKKGSFVWKTSKRSHIQKIFFLQNSSMNSLGPLECPEVSRRSPLNRRFLKGLLCIEDNQKDFQMTVMEVLYKVFSVKKNSRISSVYGNLLEDL